MDATAYLAQLQALLPTGPAWPRDADAALTDLLAAFADELGRFDARAEQLLDETDVRSTEEMIGDWERVLGLPNACTAAVETIEGRRLAAYQKLALSAGQTPAFYIGLAASIGVEIEIHEFDPAVDAYDDSLTPLITDGRWRFVWRVHVVSSSDFWLARADVARAGDRIQEGGTLDLECLISAARPAHTYVIFTYAEA